MENIGLVNDENILGLLRYFFMCKVPEGISVLILHHASCTGGGNFV